MSGVNIAFLVYQNNKTSIFEKFEIKAITLPASTVESNICSFSFTWFEPNASVFMVLCYGILNGLVASKP